MEGTYQVMNGVYVLDIPAACLGFGDFPKFSFRLHKLID